MSRVWSCSRPARTPTTTSSSGATRAHGLYGANAHSRYPGLVGRPAEYPTLRALAESYVPFYFSDRTLDPKDLTLVGFSEPIDLVAKYGTAWMGAEEPLWDIYYTYIDDAVPFHYFFDDPGRPHLYPAVRALKENWIRLDAAGEPFVSLDDLPAGARREWDAFWKTYGPKRRATAARPGQGDRAGVLPAHRHDADRPRRQRLRPPILSWPPATASTSSSTERSREAVMQDHRARDGLEPGCSCFSPLRP